MSEPDAHRQLVAHLDELTERLSEADDPKERASIALLIAQARKEIEQAREVRGSIEQPWWKSQLLYGIAIAAFGIAAYFLEFVEPLLSKNVEIVQAEAELQKIENERQRAANEAQQQANLEQQVLNERQAQENARVKARNQELESAVEAERQKTLVANEELQSLLARVQTQEQKVVAALENRRDDTKATSAEVDAQIETIKESIDETQKAIDEAAQVADRLAHYQLVVREIDLVNCEGIVGAATARLFTVADEPVLYVDERRVWPEVLVSLECGKAHGIDVAADLLQTGSEIGLYESDGEDEEPLLMGRITLGPLARDATCDTVVAATSGSRTFSDGWCRTTFRANDGEYALVWKIESK